MATYSVSTSSIDITYAQL